MKTKEGSWQWSSFSITVPLTGDELLLIDTLTEGTSFLVKKLLNQLSTKSLALKSSSCATLLTSLALNSSSCTHARIFHASTKSSQSTIAKTADS